MTPIRHLLCGASALALAGCAAKGTPPPQITYDTGDFVPAAVEPEPPKPVEIVAVPEPLPLPGQLKPAPNDMPDASDDRSPTERVNDANETARLEPAEDGYINAVQVYPFTKGALYRLYASPEQVSDIVLQPGERLVAVSAGDTVRWVVGDTTSGTGDRQQVHVLVKPVAPDLQTNLVITTDRRAYHLELESTEETYMASVSWHYPREELVALRRQNERASEALGVAQGLALDRLRFRYEITGDNPPWRPLRAFDDTHKVYIEFPRRIDQGEAPPLFVVGPEGDAELVNYRVRGNYYIVDRLFAAAELRLGEDPQQVVRISRTDGRQAKAAPARDETEVR
jgi:type IV secretion system protein VirB9